MRRRKGITLPVPGFSSEVLFSNCLVLSELSAADAGCDPPRRSPFDTHPPSTVAADAFQDRITLSLGRCGNVAHAAGIVKHQLQHVVAAHLLQANLGLRPVQGAFDAGQIEVNGLSRTKSHTPDNITMLAVQAMRSPTSTQVPVTA